PGKALARQHTRFVAVRDALVLAEHEADLTLPHADIACGYVRVLAQMTVEFRHEGLAEAHDLHLGAALRIEVGPAFGSADGQPRQGILECLLEAEELDDAEIDAGVEPETALIRPEGGVEADAEPAIDLHLSLVVGPGHAEDDLTLGLADPLDEGAIRVIRMLRDHPAYAVEDIPDGLMELQFSGIPPEHVREDWLELLVQRRHCFLTSTKGSAQQDRSARHARSRDQMDIWLLEAPAAAPISEPGHIRHTATLKILASCLIVVRQQVPAPRAVKGPERKTN